MKIIRSILVASVSLAAFSALRADNSFGRQWISHYNENPRPQDLIAAVSSLDRDGYFETAAQRETAIGFLSVVLRQNPQDVNSWLRASARVLPEQPRRILAAAAWYAGSPAAARQLQELSASDNSAERDGIDRLVASGSQSPVAEIPVNSEPAMNLQWGAFLASGDERYVTNIFAALGSDQPGLSTSARFALAKNAAENPRVMEICREQLDRQPETIRAAIQAAMNDAQAQKPGA